MLVMYPIASACILCTHADPGRARVMTAPLRLDECCLFFLAARSKTFPPAALSLLPVHIRCQLLRLLPAVELWRLENCRHFLERQDMEEVWRERLASHVLSWEPRVGFRERATARESYLYHVSRVLVLSLPRGFIHGPSNHPHIADTSTMNKWSYLFFLFHGVISQYEPPPFGFVPFGPSNSSCLIPSLYRHIIPTSSSGNTLPSLSYLMQQSRWGPRVVELGCEEHLDPSLTADPSSHILRDFLSVVEEVNVLLKGEYITLDAMGAVTILQVAAEVSPRLQSLKVEASWTVLRYLVSKLTKSYGRPLPSLRFSRTATARSKERGTCTQLKRLEIKCASCHGASISYPATDLSDHSDEWGILLSQDILEELCISDLKDNFPEELANFLPHLLATRPSLRRVCLCRCLLGWNSVEAAVQTFLRTPTAHPQTLDLGACWVGSESSRSCFSFMRKAVLHPALGPTCCSGELKTLSVPFSVGGPCCLPWLLDQPGFQLRELELTIFPTEAVLQQLYRLLSGRPSGLPVGAISLCLYPSPTLWSAGNSEALQQLATHPAVVGVTTVNFEPHGEVQVVVR